MEIMDIVIVLTIKRWQRRWFPVRTKLVFPLTEVILLTAYGKIRWRFPAALCLWFYIVKEDDNYKIIPLLQKSFWKSNSKVQQLEKRISENIPSMVAIGKSKD
jgi:hypothetical protein